MVGKKKGLDFKDLVRQEVTGNLPEQFLKWLEVEKHYSPNTRLEDRNLVFWGNVYPGAEKVNRVKYPLVV